MRQNHPAPDSAELHRWDVSLRDALEIQKRLRKRLSLKDGFVFGRLRRIAGADVAYAADGKTIFGAVVVLSFPELMIVEESWAKDKVGFPYLPGLLSFREAPMLIRACGLLKQRPDLIIFDGQGIAHPRRLGLASHAGLWLGLPSVAAPRRSRKS